MAYKCDVGKAISQKQPHKILLVCAEPRVVVVPIQVLREILHQDLCPNLRGKGNNRTPFPNPIFMSFGHQMHALVLSDIA